MSTISEKKYIQEIISNTIIEFRRDGMPMTSVAMCLIAAAWVVLKHELGEDEARIVLKRSVDEIPRDDGA